MLLELYSGVLRKRKLTPGLASLVALVAEAGCGLHWAAASVRDTVFLHKGENTLEVLLTAEQISRRVTELAAEIDAHFAGRRPHLVCILKGACVFLADLMRALTVESSLDFMGVSSYDGGSAASGEVRITKDLDHSLEGLVVLLVEDIVDTGLTLNYLRQMLLRRNPASLKVAALLDKPSRRVQPVVLDFVGFEVPDRFLVGYGLDFEQRYRHLPDLCLLPEAAA